MSSTAAFTACTLSHLSDLRSGPADKLTVEIDNREFADFSISLVRNGINFPLGQVDGMTRRTIVVPTAFGEMTGQIALVASTQSGSESLRSPMVTVARGQVIAWRVERTSHGADITVK